MELEAAVILEMQHWTTLCLKEELANKQVLITMLLPYGSESSPCSVPNPPGPPCAILRFLISKIALFKNCSNLINTLKSSGFGACRAYIACIVVYGNLSRKSVKKFRLFWKFFKLVESRFPEFSVVNDKER